MHFKMSSTICFKLDPSKILSSSNGLNLSKINHCWLKEKLSLRSIFSFQKCFQEDSPSINFINFRNLFKDELLPKDTHIIGYARSQLTVPDLEKKWGPHIKVCTILVVGSGGRGLGNLFTAVANRVAPSQR